MKLRGLVPSSHIHVAVSDLHIPKIAAKKVDRSLEYINRSQIHECRNLQRGRAVSFLGIIVSNFRYSAFAVHACENMIIGRRIAS
jgi:hypothetical protein